LARVTLALTDTVSSMITLARWTTRTFDHTLPLGLYPAVLERLRGTPARAAELLHQFSKPLRYWRAAPSWSAQQHIGHLDDLHDLDIRRLQDYASGSAVLSAADMTNRRTDEADHNTVSTDVMLDRLRAHREELTRRLEELDETQAARTARHPRLQRPMRIIDWMYFVAEHDDHHLASAREILKTARGAE
jgi:hypothetical protein